MQEPNLYAFQILNYWKTDDLRRIKVIFPLVAQHSCPADETKLQVICTMFGNNGKQRIRIGACDNCGYIRYVDYPSKKWLDKFYRSEWLSVREKDVIAEVNRRRGMSKYEIESDRAIRTRKLERFLKRHKIAKNRWLLEIGCGFGQSLSYFNENGYQVIGCETSDFRAKVAKRAYGIDVKNVSFEDSKFQKTISKFRFGLVFLHHVLEHVCDPRDMIRRISKLQSVGDYIIVGVPDVYTEPTIMTLFYFPHRSAFTKQSIINLFHTFAYELVDDFSDAEEIYLVGRRVNRPIKIKRGEHYIARSIGKFSTNLGLGRKYFAKFRCVWCYRRLGFNHGGQVIHLGFTEGLIGRWYRTIAHKLLMLYLYYKYRHLEAYISFIVKDVSIRYSQYSKSPIEIQFDKNITLLTK